VYLAQFKRSYPCIYGIISKQVWRNQVMINNSQVAKELLDEGCIKYVYTSITKDVFKENYKNFSIGDFVVQASKHNKQKLFKEANRERILSFTYQLEVDYPIYFNLNAFVNENGKNIEAVLENKFNISSLDIMSETYLNEIADKKYLIKEEVTTDYYCESLDNIEEALISITNIEEDEDKTYLLICWHIVPAKKQKESSSSKDSASLIKTRKIREAALIYTYQFLIAQENAKNLNQDFSFDMFVHENARDIEEIFEKRFHLSSKDLINNKLFDGILRGLYNSDSIIDELSVYINKNWSFERLGKMEQAILLDAYIEIKDELTENVDKDKSRKQIVINEAVDLAKKYAEENSYKFINGILDNINV